MTIIQPPGVQWLVNSLQLKLGYSCDVFSQMYYSWAFYVGGHSESSSTYDMIIVQGRALLGELGIIMNFNDHTIIWDTDTFPIKTEIHHFIISGVPD
jgi:hypothetical protein